jgi:ligand-binding sensor domain-containing protein
MKFIGTFLIFTLFLMKMQAQVLQGTTHFPVANWTWFFSAQQQINGAVVVGDDDGTLIKYENAAWTTTKIAGATNNRITAVRTLSNGKIWVGTDKKGLFFFDGTIWNNFSTTNSSLPENDIKDIEIAADGSVWVGTYGGLVKISTNNTFTIFKEANGLKGTSAIDLQFKGTTLWIGGFNFLTKMVGTTFTSYEATNFLNGFSQSLYQISISPAGKIWICAGFDGVACFNSTTNSFVTLPAAVKNEYAQAILVDKNENVWIGVTNFGLKTWNGSTLTNFESSTTIVPNGQLTRMIQTTDGHIWLVGLGGGVLELTSWNLVGTDFSIGNKSDFGLKAICFSAENQLNFRWNALFLPDFVEIFDQNGRFLFSEKIKNPQNGQFQVANFQLSKGVLTARFSGNGQVGLVRFLNF